MTLSFLYIWLHCFGFGPTNFSDYFSFLETTVTTSFFLKEESGLGHHTALGVRDLVSDVHPLYRNTPSSPSLFTVSLCRKQCVSRRLSVDSSSPRFPLRGRSRVLPSDFWVPRSTVARERKVGVATLTKGLTYGPAVEIFDSLRKTTSSRLSVSNPTG